MYNFDEIIDRKNTNSKSVENFRTLFKNHDLKLNFKNEDLIRMWIADMEIATPDFVIDAVKKRLDKKIFGYSKVFDPEYFEVLNNWCKRRYDWSFQKNELVMSDGIVNAIYELVEYITKPDEKILFFTPSYPPFKGAAEHNSREYVCSALENHDNYYTINFEDFEKKCADSKTTLLILCNPHNPTGRAWNKSELEKISEIVKKYNLWIISDEIHCDLTRLNVKHIPMGKIMTDYEKLITCIAPTKTFNIAGFMISNIIIRSDKLRNIWKIRHHDSDNPLSIAASQAAYKNGDLWLDSLRKYLDENFKFIEKYLSENIKKAKFKIPEATYLAWLDLREYFTPDENITEFFAANAGVLLEDGKMFVENADGFVRLNIACPKSILAEAMKRISNVINSKMQNA